MANNKVKYGLKNVYYAVATIANDGTATYAKPVAWRGAVNLSLDAEGDTTKFRADNIDYWVGQSNNGYSGSFESALIPDSFKVDVLGYVVDSNGVMVEDSGALTVPFALMFQFEGDQHATRHVFYNCTASRPSVSGQTTESTITPQTETVNMTASSVYNSALKKDLIKGKVEVGDAPYETWFDEVYQSGSSPAPVTTKYTVTFDVDGGSAVEPQEVEEGGLVTEPEDPTKALFTFGGWYKDSEFVTAWDFANDTITANTTIYAKWETT